MPGLQDRIGPIAVGKQADLVLVQADALNLQPVHDPIGSVIMQSSPSNSGSVVLAGRWRKREGRLVWGDLEPLAEELCESGRRISRDVGLRPADLG